MVQSSTALFYFSPSWSAFLEFSQTRVRSENKRVNGLKISHLFQVTSTDIEMQWKITEPGRLAWKIPKFITQKGERQASENFHENSILRLVTVGGQSVGFVFEQQILTKTDLNLNTTSDQTFTTKIKLRHKSIKNE